MSYVARLGQFSTTNTLKMSLLAACALLVGTVHAAEPFNAGSDYTVIPNGGTVEQPGKIEVREFFWYGCPHCFRLEPAVAAWAKTKPADVNFIRTPAALNPVWEQNARAFYAADMLGQTEKVHAAVFDAIQTQRQRLFDQASLANFYASKGVDAAKFNGLYNSFAVTGKVAQSKALAMKYQLDGVPVMVVNGKYVVHGEDGRVLQVVNYLINKERALMPKTAPAKPTSVKVVPVSVKHLTLKAAH